MIRLYVIMGSEREVIRHTYALMAKMGWTKLAEYAHRTTIGTVYAWQLVNVTPVTAVLEDDASREG